MVKIHRYLKRMFTAVLFFLLTVRMIIPLPVSAEEPAQKVVRVGWYDSSFNTIDQFGRRSGYAYEYQLKVASYTGWTYEYIGGSWSQLLQMLVNGEIDLLSDVSYTEERNTKMLFPDFPMGAEEYYLFVGPDNREITSSDPHSLNGKRIGANKDSVQADYCREWADQNGVSAELIELVNTEDESLAKLETGELDAYVTVDSFVNPKRAVPVFKVGSSDFFFAVSNSRPDLLNELNLAMQAIQDENRYFNQQMFEKYIRTSGANSFLSPEELSWLSGHGPIRVGYQDNYLAFCAKDRTTGELTGAIRDYLGYAEDCLENADLTFETAAYPTVEAAIEALKNDEVDCVFPANLGGFDGEKLGITMSPSLMNTDIFAIIRQADVNTFANREYVVAAVNQGNPNYDAFLYDHYPTWRKVYFEDTEACLKAVSDHVADCVLVSSYRYNNISRLCEKLHLTTFPTATGIDYSFAVKKGNTRLYSVLSKMISQIPTSAVNSALSYYITEDSKRTIGDIVSDNLAAVIAVSAVLIAVILYLLLKSMKAEKKAKELISATETDSLTGLYNRDYFFQYANAMYREHPETPRDAIVVNIEQFHAINALNGRDFGDQILRILGNDMRLFAEEKNGIAGRFGADRFDLYCDHSDAYKEIFDRLQGKIDTLAPGAHIRLRMGVRPYQEGVEPVQMFDMARTACSKARGHFKEHLIIFNEELQQKELLDQRLLNDLRRALDCYEFEVHYQPKFDISQKPPKLVGAEALIRWMHPELGMIAPPDFIPLLERAGMIAEVDKYVWSLAARQIARWRAEFGVTIPVSVNLSRVDVFDPKLESVLDNILQQNGLEHNALELEVTESAYTENEDELIHVVENLHKKGYTVEMDDFGTGYSSLSMLSALPIDVLKMDRTFIHNIGSEGKNVQLVALILGIADSLHIPVIAEGVESEAQLKLLEDLGCTLVQGFCFSKPVHPSDFEKRFLENRGGDV